MLSHAGVDMIMGCNGLIWVSPHDASRPNEAQQAAAAAEEAVLVMPTMPSFTPKQHAQASCVANAIRALALLYLPIHSHSIQAVCEVTLYPFRLRLTCTPFPARARATLAVTTGVQVGTAWMCSPCIMSCGPASARILLHTCLTP